MGQRNRAKEKIELDGLPNETTAGVIIAQMRQAQSDAKTHPDPGAREWIVTDANLLLDLLAGYTTSAVVAAITRLFFSEQAEH